MSNAELNVQNHDRDSAGMRYVYPVVSRRAGGVSVGINLNTNNACNWRCIYCQVPDLKPGTAPPVDLALLNTELRGFLHELLYGNFMQERVPESARRINDIALSGNGEPTTSKEFSQVVDLIELISFELKLPESIKLILITNGSMMHRDDVQSGLRKMTAMRGEVWFKVDRASSEGMQLVNDSRAHMDKVKQGLMTSISLCSTWLQTCWFGLDGLLPSAQDEEDYLNLLRYLLDNKHVPKGVLLYTLARPSLQPEAPRLSALTFEQMNLFAERIRQLGLEVKVSV